MPRENVDMFARSFCVRVNLTSGELITMTPNYSIGIARSSSELEAFRPVWAQWQNHPDNDIDNFLLLLKARKGILRPHVVLFANQGQPVLLLVCRLERQRQDFNVGYKTIRGPLVTSLTVPYRGVLGDLRGGLVPIILKVLVDELRRVNADKLEFHGLPEGSPMLSCVQRSPGAVVRVVEEEWTLHWKLALPANVEAFWAKLSSRHRMFLRRMSKTLQSDYAGEVEYSAVSEEAQVGRLCEDIEEVAKKTYLRGLGKGFHADQEHIDRIANAARSHRLRAFLLYAAGRVRSYAVGSVYGDEFALAYTAYDPEFSRYDVGQLVIVHAIESLSREGIRHFDFGFGTALYKERFGDTCLKERSVSYYAPTTKGRALAVGQKVSASAYSLAKASLDKTGAIKFLKRYWRKRLAGGQSRKPAKQENDVQTSPT